MKKVNILFRLFFSFSLALLACVTVNALEHDGYIVKLSEPLASFDTLSADSEITELEYSKNVYVVDDIDTVNMLIEDGNVVYAEPNYILELLDNEPSDPYFSEQWTLDAINYSALFGTEYNGSGVTVAVIDSGLDTTHIDFADINLSDKSINLLGNGTHSDAFYRDQVGHGTFVTSQIAASTDNGTGIASIAYGAEIMVIRAVAKDTSSKYTYSRAYDDKSATIATVSSAIDYAVQNRADVINISLGITSKSDAIDEAIARAISNGIIVVAAVGNTGGTTMYYPANCVGVIGVGSLSKGTSGYTRSSFSQHNTSVDVIAPGGNVLGIQIYPASNGVWYSSPSETYLNDSGTSYASPVVAALAAIAKQIDPDIDSDGFLSLLKETSNDLGSEGYDTYYGYGYVDAKNIIVALTEDETDITVTELAEGEVYDSIALRASEADFALYDVNTDIENTVSLPFYGENAYVYRVVGEYLVKTEAVCTDDGITIDTSGGIYAVSSAPLLLYGDANSDGDITLTDVIRVLKKNANGETVLDIAAADVSGDCAVTIVDVLGILNELLKH